MKIPQGHLLEGASTRQGHHKIRDGLEQTMKSVGQRVSSFSSDKYVREWVLTDT